MSKRKYNPECIKYGFIAILHRGEYLPQCVVCIRGVRTQVFSSPTPVLILEVGILIRILFATQLRNPNPEKILLTHLPNQCATIKMFVSKRSSGYRFVSGPSYLKSDSSVTCNGTVTHDECVVQCTMFGINALNLNQSCKSEHKVWKHLKKVKKWSLCKCNH